MARLLNTIALEIRDDWRKPFGETFISAVNPAAKAYLDAMQRLCTIDDKYGLDSARSIVSYFLANAGTWRGETARRVKKELNDMLKAARA